VDTDGHDPGPLAPEVDAQRWLDEQTVALVHGKYVHPERSRLTVGEWAETWLAGRSHLKPKTRASCRSLLSTRDLPRLPTTDRRYLTRAQLADLAEHCGPHRLLVLGYTGLRWGEAAGLRVRRVHLLRGRIEVAESVTDVDGRMVFGPPKSHAQRRVPVPRFLRDDLAVQLAGLGPDDRFRRLHQGRAVDARARLGRHDAGPVRPLFGDELDAVADRMDAARADWMRTEDRSAPVRHLG
jgi:integrase